MEFAVVSQNVTIMERILQDGMKKKVAGFINSFEAALCRNGNKPPVYEADKVHDLIAKAVAANPTMGNMQVIVTLYGKDNQEYVYQSENGGNLYEYWVKISKDSKGICCMLVHLPEAIQQKAKTKCESMVFVFERILGHDDVLMEAYRPEILPLTRWATSLSKWRVLKSSFVADEQQFLDAKKDAKGTVKEYPSDTLKAFVVLPAEEQGDTADATLVVFVPEMDCYPELTDNIKNTYREIDPGMAKRISAEVYKIIGGKKPVKLCPAYKDVFELVLELSQRGMIGAANLASDDGELDRKDPAKKIAAFLADKDDMTFELLVYLPTKTSGLVRPE
jgi:hypothetical protein